MLINIAFCFIGAISLFLAWHPKYPDGLTGRAAFMVLVVVSVVVLIGEWGGAKVRYEFMSEMKWFILAVAWFLIRHCYRFVLWAHWGRHAWNVVRRPSPEKAG